ncbi:VRR-NUC domain-containing protein [Algivirga pacifica]|uniref:phosphodiesterase I n=1 Tax=Algivirga pacifica TaxID=1162670 RepID=A0ABP9DJ65_9BACT
MDGRKNNTLPEGYYLNNFNTLLNFVEKRYQDLLTPEEITFKSHFHQLSENAQRLYVRIIMRKGPYLREDKLSYPEINIPEGLHELHYEKFININPTGDLIAALNTLIKNELIQVIQEVFRLDNIKGIANLKKDELLHFIVEQEETEAIWQVIDRYHTLLEPCYYDKVLLFRLLFFGNLEQDFHEFILEDLGILRYEPYPIRKEDRFFHHRAVIDYSFLGIQAKTALYLAEKDKSLEEMLFIGEYLQEHTPPPSLQKKWEKCFEQIAYLAERMKALDVALHYYKLCSSYYSRERTVRVLDKMEAYQEALLMAEQMLKFPTHEEEEAFAQKFLNKLKKKMALPYTAIPRETFSTDQWKLQRQMDLSIEELTLEAYQAKGMNGFYSENLIWSGLFGLLFWDIIFAPIPGVFFNPFQRGPADLFQRDFYTQRASLIKQRLKEIQHTDKLSADLQSLWNEKYNTANYLVSWKKITLKQLQQVVEVIPRKHLIAILERMGKNLRSLRSGFPDLILFGPEPTSYMLVEVKGPGDQLRPNQKAWLRFFEQEGIPCRVAKVQFES